MTKQNRLPWCDAVRLLALFMLLCCHAADPFYASVAYASNGTSTTPELLRWAIRWGSLVRPCVPLFVMLTGVLSLPVKSSMEQFYKKRIPRVLSEPRHLTNELIRRYYVGITRAKHRLFIHTNSSLFDRINADKKYVDSSIYEMPNEIVLQLSHKDVNLGYFKDRKKDVLALRAGQKLRYDNNYLIDINTNKTVGQLSQKIIGELSMWREKNYNVSDVAIRFIVAWRPKDAPKEESEYAVLLVDLTLNKRIDKEN